MEAWTGHHFRGFQVGQTIQPNIAVLQSSMSVCNSGNTSVELGGLGAVDYAYMAFGMGHVGHNVTTNSCSSVYVSERVDTSESYGETIDARDKRPRITQPDTLCKQDCGNWTRPGSIGVDSELHWQGSILVTDGNVTSAE